MTLDRESKNFHKMELQRVVDALTHVSSIINRDSLRTLICDILMDVTLLFDNQLHQLEQL